MSSERTFVRLRCDLHARLLRIDSAAVLIRDTAHVGGSFGRPKA